MSMLSTLVLSCTYQCPIQCRFCGAECGPKQRERLALADMKDLVDRVHSFGKLELVVFTGGEPFLLGADLLHAVEYCMAKGISTRIVTNAYWATTAERAQEVIRTYKRAGLSEINLSCDDYHQEYIPLIRIKFANSACVCENMPCLIGHKVMKDYKITLDYLEDFLGCKLARFDPKAKNPLNNVVSTGYTVPVAEDMHLIPDEEILYPPSDSCWKSPCTTILQRVIITPRKELSICCGMIRRNVREILFGPLEENRVEELIVRAHRDLIVNWLALEGPYGLMRFIQKKKPDIHFRNQYVNICHLCSEIFTRSDCRAVLCDHAAEKIDEIMLERELYDYMRTQKKADLEELVASL